MAQSKSRTPPIACRPTVENKWLYKSVRQWAKANKTSISKAVETILVNYFNCTNNE